MRIIGIDIGGTKCAVVLGDDSGNILKKVKFKTAALDETLSSIIGTVRDFGKCDAIGISCGGPLNAEKGIIMSPPNLPGWDDVHITDLLKEEFNVPVFLKNDADACAIAEWKFGAGKGTKNMIFITFGTGLGAGLILNGQLYSGATDNAGEIGHIRLAEDGPVGYGKRGSFEGFCSGGGIAQLAKTKAMEMLQMGKKASYCNSLYELDEITAKSVADKADEGNADAREVYHYSGKMLGKGLSILIDILNPEKIVIGSIFARSENLLREEMQRVINSECLSFTAKKCDIVPAILGESIGDIAALSVAIDALGREK